MDGVQFVHVSLEDAFKLRVATNSHVSAIAALARGEYKS